MSLTIKKAFPILGLSIFSSMVGLGIIAPLLPIYAKNLGATGVWVGVIFAGYAISRTVILPFVGKLSDRRGRKLVIAVGLFIFALTSFAYVLADNLASLLVIRLLQGVAAGLVQPIAQAYIGDIAPEGEEGKWMGLFNATFLVGWGCGPLMGGILTDYFGMDSAFYVMGVLNVLAFLGVALFLPDTIHKKREAVAGASFKDIASSNLSRGLFSFQIGDAAHRGIVQTFIPVFGGLTIGLSTSLIGTILSVLVLGAGLIQIFSGRLADRFNRRVIVILGSLGILISMLLIPFSVGFWTLMVFLAIAIIGDATALPSASALVIEEGRKFGMGMAMAMFNMGMGVGLSVGPILAGLAADLMGIESAFYFTAILMLVCTIAFGRFTRRQPGVNV
ncbi:MAG: MFS transporter [Dehalococcoidales bacterium]|nr:MFS transporter [Dehalococcoidales bacterium]